MHRAANFANIVIKVYHVLILTVFVTNRGSENRYSCRFNTVFTAHKEILCPYRLEMILPKVVFSYFKVLNEGNKICSVLNSNITRIRTKWVKIKWGKNSSCIQYKPKNVAWNWCTWIYVHRIFHNNVSYLIFYYTHSLQTWLDTFLSIVQRDLWIFLTLSHPLISTWKSSM